MKVSQCIPSEGPELKIAKPGLARAGRVQPGPQHGKTVPHVVVIAGDFHAAVEALPVGAVEVARVKADDVTIIGHPHPQAPPMRIRRAGPLDAVLMSDEAFGVEPEPTIELVVVEEQESRDATGRDLDVAFELIRLVASDQEQR